jgi:hypothetical protein
VKLTIPMRPSAEVKNEWNYTATAFFICFHGVDRTLHLCVCACLRAHPCVLKTNFNNI